MIKASIIGGSGYVGGELLRLLLMHPEIEVAQVTSRGNLGLYVYQTHPNLRKQTSLKFSSPETLEPVDVLFLALPHGQAQKEIEHYAELAPRIVDLSADFRLRDAADYQQWYSAAHAAPEWLNKFVYGLPEVQREALRTASYVSGVGCNATAAILALLPLVQADLIENDQPVILEIKAGSSEGGAQGNPGSHHPERSSVIRTFSASGPRSKSASLTTTKTGCPRKAALAFPSNVPRVNSTRPVETTVVLTERPILRSPLKVFSSV